MSIASHRLRRVLDQVFPASPAPDGFDPFLDDAFADPRLSDSQVAPEPDPFLDAIERMRAYINQSDDFTGVTRYQLDQGLWVLEGYRDVLRYHLKLFHDEVAQQWKYRALPNCGGPMNSRFYTFRGGIPERALKSRGIVRFALTNLYNRAEFEVKSYERWGDPVPEPLTRFLEDWSLVVKSLKKLDDEFIGRHTATTNQYFPSLTVSPFDEPEPEGKAA